MNEGLTTDGTAPSVFASISCPKCGRRGVVAQDIVDQSRESVTLILPCGHRTSLRRGVARAAKCYA